MKYARPKLPPPEPTAEQRAAIERARKPGTKAWRAFAITNDPRSTGRLIPSHARMGLTK